MSSNPRYSALPAEIMRSCSFAENFVRESTVVRNGGTDTGTGNTFDMGLTADGNGYVPFDVITQPSDFSVVIRFSSAGVYTNLLADPDMELEGTDEWDLGGTITKDLINPHGGLRSIKCLGTFASITQAGLITTGHGYTVSGWAKSDGTDIPTVRTTGNTVLWLGTNSTEWQYFKVSFVSTDGTEILFRSQTAGSSTYVNFDDLSIVENMGILCATENIIDGTPSTGFCIWADGDGVKARSSNGTAISDELSIDVDYTDGEIHAVTYIVDMDGTSGTQTLLYDDEFDTGEHNFETAISTAKTVKAAGDGTNNFVGSIYKIRIFDVELGPSEPDLYRDDLHGDNPFDFVDSPTAVWRCDSFGNDAVGHLVWDKGPDKNDLTKGDGETASTFPTFDTNHYNFDGAGDYLSDFPDLPTARTTTVLWIVGGGDLAFSSSNTSSIFDNLESGTWGTKLYSLALWPKTLTQLELYHAEYIHNYWVPHGEAADYYGRLITEGACNLSMFLDVTSWSVYNTHPDYAPLGADGTAVNTVTRNDEDGVTFPNSNSHILVSHESGLNSDRGTIAVMADITGVGISPMLVKGTNYSFSLLTNALAFNSVTTSTVTFPFSHVAVTFQDGENPKFYIDGEFFFEGAGPATVDDTDINHLVIGNNGSFTNKFDFNMQQICLCSKVLTSTEIRALYQSAVKINAGR